MLFVLDPSHREPLASQLAIQVRSAIATGDLVAGERLPPARELASALDINMHTVLRAYHQLRAESLIHLRPGRGAYVRPDVTPSSPVMSELIGTLIAQARHIGLTDEELIDQISQQLKEDV